MGFKFKNILTGKDEVDEYYGNEESHSEVKDLNMSGILLLEPRAYSEAKQIADYLKNNNVVVVKLSKLKPDVALKIFDFLSGVVYAIEGKLKKLGEGSFLCTPKDVNVEGSMSDDKSKEDVKEDW